jgi:hypothetical protein
VIIGDHLVERKRLKQVEIKGLKEGFKVLITLSPSLGSIKQIQFK